MFKTKYQFFITLFKNKYKILRNKYYGVNQNRIIRPSKAKNIKEKYKRKIITALTIKDKSDVDQYKLFSNVIGKKITS